ncbi:hypothetical protein DSUL_200004 [Desulfovibrionales bacterium]
MQKVDIYLLFHVFSVEKLDIVCVVVVIDKCSKIVFSYIVPLHRGMGQKEVIQLQFDAEF